MQSYDFEVIQDDETISSLRAVELRSLGAVWGQIAELTKKVCPKKPHSGFGSIRRDTHFHWDRHSAPSPIRLTGHHRAQLHGPAYPGHPRRPTAAVSYSLSPRAG